MRESDESVLGRFRAALADAYGARLERAVLFGSRARGEERADSDYDVAVFLREMTDETKEMDRLADLSTEILYATGGLVHAMPFVAGAYADRTPLMYDVREDGVDL